MTSEVTVRDKRWAERITERLRLQSTIFADSRNKIIELLHEAQDGNAAQLLNNGGKPFGLKRFTNWLREHRWLRRENGGNIPFQDKVDAGLLTTKAYRARFNPENGDYKTFAPKPLVTAKGIAKLHSLIYGETKQDMEKAA